MSAIDELFRSVGCICSEKTCVQCMAREELMRIRSRASLTDRAACLFRHRIEDDGCADANTLEWLEEYKRL